MAVGATGTPTVNFSIPRYATGADAPNGSGFNSAMDYIDNLLKEAPMSSKITGLVDGDAVVWDTTTGTWVRVTGTKDGTKFLRDDGTWAAAVPAGWTSYVPVWTATGVNPSPGNATLTGKYVQIGKLVVVRVALIIGSTSTMGTGGWRFSLPVTAHADAVTRDWGRSSMVDFSVPQRFSGAAYVATTTTIAVPHLGVSGALVIESAEIGATAPFTWAVTDDLTVNLVYEAA